MASGNGIVGQGESLRRALRWLSERRLEDPKVPRLKLIEDAALRFDLTPAEADFLAMEWKDT
jgi:hypothetical protein